MNATGRHAFRAQWHDYNEGIYFVTICSAGKSHLFGHICKGDMQMSELGKIVEECVSAIPHHNPGIELINYVVMPNHVHLLVGARYIAPASTKPTKPINAGCLKSPAHGKACADLHHNSLLAVTIGTFKAAVSREYRRMMWARCIAPLPGDCTRPIKIWQRLFHEHIVRDQRAFDNINQYIDNNVINWSKDCFYQ